MDSICLETKLSFRKKLLVQWNSGSANVQLLRKTTPWKKRRKGKDWVLRVALFSFLLHSTWKKVGRQAAFTSPTRSSQMLKITWRFMGQSPWWKGAVFSLRSMLLMRRSTISAQMYDTAMFEEDVCRKKEQITHLTRLGFAFKKMTVLLSLGSFSCVAG